MYGLCAMYHFSNFFLLKLSVVTSVVECLPAVPPLFSSSKIASDTVNMVGSVSKGLACDSEEISYLHTRAQLFLERHC